MSREAVDFEHVHDPNDYADAHIDLDDNPAVGFAVTRESDYEEAPESHRRYRPAHHARPEILG